MNLFERFHLGAAKTPARPFIETDTGKIYDYGAVQNTTARYAGVLKGLGLRPGDRIAAQVDKSPEALLVYLASLRAGLAYLPLNTAYQPAELEYFLGDAKPRAVVCAPSRQPVFQQIIDKSGADCAILTLDSDGNGSLPEQAVNQPDNFPIVARAPDDLAAILYTSGTTGRPKGAMLTHNNLLSNAIALHESWGFTPDDVLLHALPLFHVHGLFVACHCVLLSTAKMFFVSKFDTAKIIELLPRCTVMMGVPTFYTRLLDDPAFTADCTKNMRLFVAGSAPLLESTFNDFHARTGHYILERYGMTETCMLTSNPLHGPRRAGTVGPPLPGVTVRVTGDNDQPLPAGSVGNVEVKGPNVFPGYWQLPEKTAEEFTADGFFKTGDIGVIDTDGYLSIVGRSKDLVISGGYNVYPKEVESVLDQFEGVAESAVFGVPHPDFGEAVSAAIVPVDTNAPPDIAALTAAARTTLAAYKVPKRIHIVDALPRNAMGKVQKNVLRERFG